MNKFLFLSGFVVFGSLASAQTNSLSSVFGEYQVISCADSSKRPGFTRPLCDSTTVAIGIFEDGLGEGIKFIDRDYPTLMLLCDGTVENGTIDLGVVGQANNVCSSNLQISSEVPVRGEPGSKIATLVDLSPVTAGILRIRVRQQVLPLEKQSKLATDAEFNLVVKKR